MGLAGGKDGEETILTLARTGSFNAFHAAKGEMQKTPLAAIHRRKCIRDAGLEYLFRGGLGGQAQFLRAQGLVVARIEADQVMLALVEMQNLHSDGFKCAKELTVVLRQQRYIGSAQLHVNDASFEPLGVASAVAGSDSILEAHSPKLVKVGEESGDFLGGFLQVGNRHHNQYRRTERVGAKSENGKSSGEIKVEFVCCTSDGAAENSVFSGLATS